MSKYCTFFFGLFFISLINANAQIPNRFLLFDVKSGLSQNSVTCFFEDSKGLMWIGTQDGLNSFDGRTFVQFICDPNDSATLSNKYIVKIKEDVKGNMWVGTAFGLNRLNPITGKADRIFLNEERERRQSISIYDQFFFDKDHNLLVLYGRRIFKVNIQTLDVTQQSNVEASKLIESQTKQHQYIIRDDSVFDFHANTYIVDLASKLGTSKILKAMSNDNYVLLYSEKVKPTIQIFSLKQHRWVDSIILPSKAFDLKISTDNTIDVALNNGFISFQNLKKADLIYYDTSNPQSIPSGPILSTFTDSKHNLWIGSASSGVAVQPASFSNFTYIPSAHKNDAIQDISLQDNEIIMASNTGVYRVGIRSMELIKSFGADRVNAVLLKNDFIYAAVEQKGLFLLSKQGQVIRQFDKTNSNLQTNQIFDIVEIGKDIGLCTEKYFYKIINSNQINRIKIGNDSTKFSYVLSCSVDEQGFLYLATNNGAAILNQQGITKQLIYSNSNHAILGKTIVSRVVPYHDKLIISTLDNGLFILKNNQIIKHYNRKNGLPNNVVYNVGLTINGDIWVCTNAGIARCSKGTESFIPISIYNGLPPSYYSFGSMQCFKSSVLVGTDNGLYTGYVEQMKLSSIGFQPYIHQIAVNGQVVSTINQQIELDAYKKNIELSFGHATIFDNVFLAYQLNNLPWVILPSNQKRINFSDFPLGTNSFKIKAANSIASLNSAKPTYYTILVKTPWYLRWWVITLAIISLVSTIFYMIKNYFKRKNEQKILAFQLELNIQKERERISRDLHDNIGSYATALLSKIQQLNKENRSKDIIEMNELGNNIISNIRETIWIMQTKDIKLQDFSDKIKNYILKLKPIYPSIQMSVVDDIDKNISLSPTSTTHLFRIIQEAIHNCVKHAQATELNISFMSNSQVKITIQDNGIGYEAQQGEEHYGIKNMQERAEEINYGFSICKLNSGTYIELIYPKS